MIFLTFQSFNIHLFQNHNSKFHKDLFELFASMISRVVVTKAKSIALCLLIIHKNNTKDRFRHFIIYAPLSLHLHHWGITNKECLHNQSF